MLSYMVISVIQCTWNNYKALSIHNFLIMFTFSSVPLYGLKQALYDWFSRLSAFLKHCGFLSSKANFSTFSFCYSTGLVILLIYIDDIIVTRSSSKLITTVLSNLQREFLVKDVQPLQYFLGIHVHRTSNGILLSQQK